MGRRVAAVQRVLGGLGEVETRFTERRGHATELARESANADAIFVLSGDGGFNEVVNGLGPNAPPVACIPGGGTSVFPRGLGLPRDPLRATEHVATAFREAVGKERPCKYRPLFDPALRPAFLCCGAFAVCGIRACDGHCFLVLRRINFRPRPKV